MVRQRSKTGQGKTKRCLSRKDSTGSLVENPTGKDEGMVEITVHIPVHILVQVPGFGLPVWRFHNEYVGSFGRKDAAGQKQFHGWSIIFGLV